jgi:hypothetical protein
MQRKTKKESRMFWKKKPSPPPGNPQLIPLEQLRMALGPKASASRIEGNSLITDLGKLTNRVEAIAPPSQPRAAEPLRAIVRVSTTLPTDSSLAPFQHPAGLAALNAFASLGAAWHSEGRLLIGSRISIFEAEAGMWTSLHMPLLAYTILTSADAILGGFQSSFGGANPPQGASRWTTADMLETRRLLAPMCACSAGHGGFTAEFPLEPGAVTAAMRHHATALLELTTEQPHPLLGAGLFCLLRMPHTLTQERSEELATQLNELEFHGLDQAPHLGAWSPNMQGDGLAYVSFLPNFAYGLRGISANVAIWSAHRAQWAHAQLKAKGIRL